MSILPALFCHHKTLYVNTAFSTASGIRSPCRNPPRTGPGEGGEAQTMAPEWYDAIRKESEGGTRSGFRAAQKPHAVSAGSRTEKRNRTGRHARRERRSCRWAAWRTDARLVFRAAPACRPTGGSGEPWARRQRRRIRYMRRFSSAKSMSAQISCSTEECA